MIWEGLLQFWPQASEPWRFPFCFPCRESIIPWCGFIGGAGWFICWGMINIFHTGAVEANFAATVFITLASRIGSTVKKCPVTLFLIGRNFS